MTDTTINPKGFSLNELLQRKEETRQAIALQEQRIAESYLQLLSPVTHIKTVSNFVGRRILAGFTLFESISWGYRIVRRLLRFFYRKR